LIIFWSEKKSTFNLLCPKDDIALTFFNEERNFFGNRQDILIYNDSLVIPLSSELLENRDYYEDWAARERSTYEKLWMVKFPYSLVKPSNNDTIIVYKYSETDTFNLKFLMPPCGH